MLKTKLDISSENFDLFFKRQLASITPQGKEHLPKDVLYKLFKDGATLNGNNPYKLKFLERLFVLWKALKKRLWVVVEDEDNGLSVEQFCELRDALKRKEKDFEKNGELSAPINFITASRELSDCFDYLNGVCASTAYRYALRTKNKPINKTTENARQLKFLVKMFMNYESNKKNVIMRRNISVPEWYVLLGLYEGNELVSSSLYKEIFIHCYQSHRSAIKAAFVTLKNKGLVVKRGDRKGATIRITTAGVSVVNEIIKNFILNF